MAAPVSQTPQNRAPFGQWKPKSVAGFLSANVDIPPDLSAEAICRQYPNHINDFVILDLMRAGKGAKAIDALIPPPVGKQKAGQSHSKIQLRVSTIRENFPNEIFPLPTSRRTTQATHQAQMQGAQMQATQPIQTAENEETTSSPSGPASPISASIQGQFAGNAAHGLGFPFEDSVPSHDAAVTSSTPMEVDYSSRNDYLAALAQRALAEHSLTEQSHAEQSHAEQSLAEQSLAEQSLADPNAAATVSSVTGLTRLESEITWECNQHCRLAISLWSYHRLLTEEQLNMTVQGLCNGYYFSQCRRYQQRSGQHQGPLAFSPGEVEYPITYLRRSIRYCFETNPVYRAQVDLNCSPEQAEHRFEVATADELLSRLKYVTRKLEARVAFHTRIGAEVEASGGLQM